MTATKSYYSATSLRPDVQLLTSKEEDYPAAVLTHNVNEEQQDQEHGKLSTASNSTVSTLLRNTALDPISAEGRERQAARSPGLIRLIAEMDTNDISSEQGVDGKKGRDYLSPLSLSRTETFSGTFYNDVTEDYDTDLEIELEVS